MSERRRRGRHREYILSDPQSTLTEAFQAFNTVSAQLIDSYRDLESRVQSLSAELALSNERRLAELAEKERLAERLSRLLNALPAGVVVLDEKEVVNTVNPAAAELLDVPLEGRAWASVRVRLRDADDGTGDYLSPRGRRVALTRREAAAAGTIVLLHDVTETRTLQERLHQHRRLTAMGEMAAGLAHQVRTPLAAAILYTEQLGRDQVQDAQRQRVCQRVSGRLRHIEKLVQDMLTFVRGGSQERSALRGSDFGHAVKRSVETELDAAGAALELDGCDDQTVLWCNPDALAGAVANVVRNAIEAAGHGARVRLGIERLGADGVAIMVEDNGPGVAPELAERIFEPFFTTRARGTGLGLAVLREIVRAHGGEVAVRPGAGGCFTIRLPGRHTLGTLVPETREVMS